MEIFEIIRYLKKKWKILVFSTLGGALLGAVLFFSVPQKYIATGLLYVQRTTESSKENVFTYEGFYGQQTAQTYTNTVIGFLESTDLHKRVLDNFQIPVTEKNLSRVSKKINVAKSSPQIIELTVKTPSQQESKDTWNFISGEAERIARDLNANGDPNLRVTPVSEPVLKEQYRRLWLNTFLGGALSLIGSALLTTLSLYFKEEIK